MNKWMNILIFSEDIDSFDFMPDHTKMKQKKETK